MTVTLSTWVPPDIVVTGVPIIAQNATTDAQGNYSVRTQPGTYKLLASISNAELFPSEVDALSVMQDVGGQDFLALQTGKSYLVGAVSAPTLAGNTVHVDGPIVATTQTDATGLYIIGPAPAGDYTLTPSSPSSAFFADDGKTAVSLPAGAREGIDFFAAPAGTTTSIITVAGDAASGVPTARFTSTPMHFLQDGPVPGLVSAGGGTWRFAAWYLSSGTSVGGDESFAGTPAPGVYTVPVARSAFSCAPGWGARSFTLTLTSVGQGATTNIVQPNLGTATATEYPVHGTFHADCGVSTGTVTFDVSF